MYKWFNYLNETKIANVIAYVIMPNHLHCILHFPNSGFDLNKIISNAKRFIAYDIIKHLQENGNTGILEQLSNELTEREKSKHQKHRVFEESFEAKAVFSDNFLSQKISYIHLNPVSKKWSLVTDYTRYEHSSAAYYEHNEINHFEPKHYSDL